MVHPIAELGSLALFDESVVQAGSKGFKALALKEIDLCRMFYRRRGAWAVLAGGMGAGVVAIAMTQFGDGPLYWAVIAGVMAGVAIAAFRAWYRSRIAFIVLRAAGHFIVARGGSPTPTRAFMDDLMRARETAARESEQVDDSMSVQQGELSFAPTPDPVTDPDPAPDPVPVAEGRM